MKKKKLTENEIELAWAYSNEIRLAVEEREILFTAQQELLREKKNVRSRIASLEMIRMHTGESKNE
jgi:hypothetical protein